LVLFNESVLTIYKLVWWFASKLVWI